MTAFIRASSDWAPGKPTKVICEVEDNDLQFSGGKGTISGKAFQIMWDLLPNNGFGNSCFEIETNGQILRGCRIIDGIDTGHFKAHKFVYLG